jgi:hypothetical protein
MVIWKQGSKRYFSPTSYPIFKAIRIQKQTENDAKNARNSQCTSISAKTKNTKN